MEVRPAELEKDTRPLAHRHLRAEFGNAYVDSQPDDDGTIYMMQPLRWLTVDYTLLSPGI